jgi:adenylate cyclase
VDEPDVEKLLDGLEGSARAERAELIEWLFEQGITAEEIRTGPVPMLAASRRLMGDDGDYVSTRKISETAGIDLELLQRVQRAVGLVRVDDPDAAVHLRADGAAAAHAKEFLELGIHPDQVVQVVRVLAEGLSHAAEVMRYTALSTILQPNATELETAKRSFALTSRIVPLLGPMIEDMLLMHLRHMMETEAVNASERAAGAPLPGARHITAAFADLVGFTKLGEEVPPEELGQLANRTGAAVGRRDQAGRYHRQRQRLSLAAGGHRLGFRGEPGRGLVRQPGEHREPGHGGVPAGSGAGRRVGAR